MGSGRSAHLSAAGRESPYINQVSPADELCEDNFYSSQDLPGDDYTWQNYHVDEADAGARDPAGGVIASVIDMAHFAKALLKSYHDPDGLLSQDGVRDLWGATTDLGCFPGCPYEPYYGVGFFTSTQPGEPVTQVGHGGSRAGYASAFVLRPEANMAVCVLANADVSTVALSDLAKTILDDAESAAGVDSEGGVSALTPSMPSIDPNPLAMSGTTAIRFSVPRDARIRLEVFNVGGRLVSTLANQTYSAGDHSVQWRPADDGLAPGAYFIRFSSLGTTNLRKVVIYQ
jgi:CubicO group peptidase (beta-lactamase class C family)